MNNDVVSGVNIDLGSNVNTDVESDMNVNVECDADMHDVNNDTRSNVDDTRSNVDDIKSNVDDIKSNVDDTRSNVDANTTAVVNGTPTGCTSTWMQGRESNVLNPALPPITGGDRIHLKFYDSAINSTNQTATGQRISGGLKSVSKT